jgi:hypothetical protein
MEMGRVLGEDFVETLIAFDRLRTRFGGILHRISITATVDEQQILETIVEV